MGRNETLKHCAVKERKEGREERRRERRKRRREGRKRDTAGGALAERTVWTDSGSFTERTPGRAGNLTLLGLRSSSAKQSQ